MNLGRDVVIPLRYALVQIMKGNAPTYEKYVKTLGGRSKPIPKSDFERLNELRPSPGEKPPLAAREFLLENVDKEYFDYVQLCVDKNIKFMSRSQFLKLRDNTPGAPKEKRPYNRVQKSYMCFVHFVWDDPEKIKDFPVEAIQEVLERVNAIDKLGWQLVKYESPAQIELRSTKK